MMPQDIFDKIKNSFDQVVDRQSPEGQQLLAQLLALHHADVALFMSNLESEQFNELFKRFNGQARLEVFEHLSPSFKARALVFVYDKEKLSFL